MQRPGLPRNQIQDGVRIGQHHGIGIRQHRAILAQRLPAGSAALHPRHRAAGSQLDCRMIEPGAAQASRHHPARRRVKHPGRGDRPVRQLARFVRFHPARVVGGRRGAGQRQPLPRRRIRVFGQMQHAAARPFRRIAQRGPRAQIVQEGRARQPAGVVVVAREHRAEHRQRIARRPLRAVSRAFQHGDGDAALRQRMCHGRPGDAGADDGDTPRHGGFIGAGLGGETRTQAMPLAAVAGAFFAGEARPLQPLAHRCRHRVGRRHRPGVRQPREFGKQSGLPEVGVAVGGETI